MLAHVVLFKTKPGVAANDPRVLALLGDLDQLPREIPEIKVWKHGANITPDPQAWDYAVYAEFESEAALQVYYDNAVHADIVRRWEEIGMLLFSDIKV